MRRLCFGLVALAATVGFAQQTGRQTRLEAAAVTPAQAPVIELEFGRFTISVSESWTAQVFHMVDQLAQWDESSHKSYTRWARTNLTLDAEDRQLLQKHAEMRRGRGWGNGFVRQLRPVVHDRERDSAGTPRVHRRRRDVPPVPAQGRGEVAQLHAAPVNRCCCASASIVPQRHHGSTDAARRAGTKLATSATARIPQTAAAKVRGSPGSTL